MKNSALVGLFLNLCATGLSLIYPTSFDITSGTVLSVNGSSTDSYCYNTTKHGHSVECINPEDSSFLFSSPPNSSGVLMANINSSYWASKLLTLHRDSFFVEIVFNFSVVAGMGIHGLELTLFNCPEWTIGVESLNIYGSMSPYGSRYFLGTLQLSLAASSCEYYIYYCLKDFSAMHPFIILQFHLDARSKWVYLASIAFTDNYTTRCSHRNKVLSPPNTAETATPSSHHLYKLPCEKELYVTATLTCSMTALLLLIISVPLTMAITVKYSVGRKECQDYETPQAIPRNVGAMRFTNTADQGRSASVGHLLQNMDLDIMPLGTSMNGTGITRNGDIGPVPPHLNESTHMNTEMTIDMNMNEAYESKSPTEMFGQ